MSDKKKIRQHFQVIRQKISTTDRRLKSEKICKHVKKFLDAHAFSQLFLFHPIKDEPDLTPLAGMVSSGCKLGLPFVHDDGQMKFYLWEKDSALTKDAYGILSPATRIELNPNSQTLVLVPALTVDDHGNRLGYGKGFYDQFLSGHSDLASMAVVFAELCTHQTLPTEPHDQAVRYVVTDAGVRKI